MSKPWLETWRLHEATSEDEKENESCIAGETYVIIPNGHKTGCWLYPEGGRERDQLMAAAPDMCSALLAMEWADEHRGQRMCPFCQACKVELDGHASSCLIDTSLTKAGLPTAESRDEARKELGL